MAEGGREEGGCPEGREVGHKLCMQPTPLLSFSFRFLPPAPPVFPSWAFGLRKEAKKEHTVRTWVRQGVSFIRQSFFKGTGIHIHEHTKKTLARSSYTCSKVPEREQGEEENFFALWLSPPRVPLSYL